METKQKEVDRKYLWHTMLGKFLKILGTEDTCFLVENPQGGKPVRVKKELFDLTWLHPSDFQSLPQEIFCHLIEDEIDKEKCLKEQRNGVCGTCVAATFGLKLKEVDDIKVSVEKKAESQIEAKKRKVVKSPPKTRPCPKCKKIIINKGEKCCFRCLSELPRASYSTQDKKLIIRQQKKHRKEKLAIEQLADKIERAAVRLENELRKLEPLLKRYRQIAKEVKDGSNI